MSTEEQLPSSQNRPASPSTSAGGHFLIPHNHEMTSITGLRVNPANGRVEPLYDAINVKANGQLLALYNAATVPGEFTPTAVPPVTISIAVQNNDGEGDDNSRGKVQAENFRDAGRITAKEFAEITKDVSPATVGVAPVATSAGDAITVAAGDLNFATVISPGGTTLGTMIKNVTFPRTIQQLSQGGPGMTPEKIVNNLGNLAYNIWEPLKRQYPQAFITNSFRQAPSGGGQHGTGQAMDVQFRGVSSDNYFDIAVWISKNLPYDQLLLEYIPNKTVWLHISYAIPGLPTGGIKVKPQNKLATLNGASGGKFVPNLHADIVAKAVPSRVVA
jgi:hypothetical protein